MKIKILSTAIEDLYEGRLFYEKQGEGLGEYFFDSLFSDIDSLVLYGGIHAKVYGYHRMLSKRFPYAIYDKLEEEESPGVGPQQLIDMERIIANSAL